MLNFIVFVIYKRDIKKEHTDNVKHVTVCNIWCLQTLVIALIIFLISFFGNFSSHISKILAILLVVAALIINNYLYVKCDYLEQIKLRFEGSKMDTKRNENIVMISILLFFVLTPILVCLLSYLKYRTNIL